MPIETVTPAAPAPPLAAPPAAAAAAPGRGLTARAIALGLALALPLAWLTPWNDWQLNNTYFFNDFLPPIVVAAALAIGLVVNPLLGRRRLARGELVVVVALVFAVGGVASSGLARYWPGVVGGPARKLVRQPPEALRVPLDERARAAVAAACAARAARDFAGLDADRDGRLSAAETWGGAERIAAADRDGDGALSRDEYLAARRAADPAARADWRWALPPDLFLGLPEAGPIDPNDPEYQRVVDGFLDGAHAATVPRVGHRARVTWRGPDGVVHARELALSGAQRERFPRAGALDLDDAVGRALVGHRAGDEVATLGGVIAILAIEPPPAVPWYAWARAGLAWAPMIVGLCLISLGMAFLVRRQWLHHERLTYPIASALGALLDDPAPGSRLPAMLRQRGFWIAFALALVVVTWRGMALQNWVPVTIPLEILDLPKSFQGEPWNRLTDYWAIFQPRIYFTFVAMAFLVPLEISFSCWFFLIGGNLVVMWLTGQGYQVTWHDAHDTGYGGYAALAPLIVWLGRKHYLAVLRAAFGGRADEHARAAAPWLWATFAGLALFAGWLWAHGATPVAAVGSVLMLTGILLVISRAVAEAGLPLITMPGGNINDFIFSTVGFGLPVAALLPIALIGMIQNDPREALMPYATGVVAPLADRAAVPSRGLMPLMLAVAVIGAAIACASAVHHDYTGHGATDHYTPYAYEMDHAAAVQRTDAAGAEHIAAERSELLWSYGVGAAITAICGLGRMFWTWWPLHPLALPIVTSWGGQQAWASFLVAWLAKLLALRYGGVGVYRRLVPVAIGLAAGESVAVVLFALFKIVATGILKIPIEAYKSALPV